jgi:hypothetical protein
LGYGDGIKLSGFKAVVSKRRPCSQEHFAASGDIVLVKVCKRVPCNLLGRQGQPSKENIADLLSIK